MLFSQSSSRSRTCRGYPIRQEYGEMIFTREKGAAVNWSSHEDAGLQL